MHYDSVHNVNWQHHSLSLAVDEKGTSLPLSELEVNHDEAEGGVMAVGKGTTR